MNIIKMGDGRCVPASRVEYFTVGEVTSFELDEETGEFFTAPTVLVKLTGVDELQATIYDAEEDDTWGSSADLDARPYTLSGLIAELEEKQTLLPMPEGYSVLELTTDGYTDLPVIALSSPPAHWYGRRVLPHYARQLWYVTPAGLVDPRDNTTPLMLPDGRVVGERRTYDSAEHWLLRVKAERAANDAQKKAPEV